MMFRLLVLVIFVLVATTPWVASAKPRIGQRVINEAGEVGVISAIDGNRITVRPDGTGPRSSVRADGTARTSETRTYDTTKEKLGYEVKQRGNFRPGGYAVFRERGLEPVQIEYVFDNDQVKLNMMPTDIGGNFAGDDPSARDIKKTFSMEALAGEIEESQLTGTDVKPGETLKLGTAPNSQTGTVKKVFEGGFYEVDNAPVGKVVHASKVVRTVPSANGFSAGVRVLSSASGKKYAISQVFRDGTASLKGLAHTVSLKYLSRAAALLVSLPFSVAMSVFDGSAEAAVGDVRDALKGKGDLCENFAYLTEGERLAKFGDDKHAAKARECVANLQAAEKDLAERWNTRIENKVKAIETSSIDCREGGAEVQMMDGRHRMTAVVRYGGDGKIASVTMKDKIKGTHTEFLMEDGALGEVRTKTLGAGSGEKSSVLSPDKYLEFVEVHTGQHKKRVEANRAFNAFLKTTLEPEPIQQKCPPAKGNTPEPKSAPASAPAKLTS